MQRCTPEGIVDDDSDTRRYSIELTHNSNADDKKSLVRDWSQKDPKQAGEMLASADIEVTNMKDKEHQLAKLEKLNQDVKRADAVAKRAAESDNSAGFLGVVADIARSLPSAQVLPTPSATKPWFPGAAAIDESDVGCRTSVRRLSYVGCRTSNTCTDEQGAAEQNTAELDRKMKHLQMRLGVSPEVAKSLVAKHAAHGTMALSKAPFRQDKGVKKMQKQCGLSEKSARNLMALAKQEIDDGRSRRTDDSSTKGSDQQFSQAADKAQSRMTRATKPPSSSGTRSTAGDSSRLLASGSKSDSYSV